MTSRLIRAALAIAACALLIPLAAGACAGGKGSDGRDAAKRVLFATDSRQPPAVPGRRLRGGTLTPDHRAARRRRPEGNRLPSGDR